LNSNLKALNVLLEVNKLPFKVVSRKREIKLITKTMFNTKRTKDDKKPKTKSKIVCSTTNKLKETNRE